MKKIALIASTAVLVLGMGTASAGGAELFAAKGCSGCHGPDAKGMDIMPMNPRLAGQFKQYVAAQMTDIKSGARNNGGTAAMKGVMAGVSADEIKEIAAWISSL
jgi:cytochrome c